MVEKIDFNTFSVEEDIDSYDKGIPSIKEIVLMHIRKLSDICCAEFRSGYWEEKPLKVGGGLVFTKVYHEDSRAVFCNAVDFLTWLVYPSSNEKFKDLIDANENNEDIKDLDLKLINRKKLFKEMCLMFEDLNYFDSSRGRTERSS